LAVRMEFRILGPLEVLDEGRRLALGGRKPRALLALLLLHRGETLGTERLIDELWGERPPATAAKSLQVHVSRLRGALSAGSGGRSDELVVTRGHGYQLVLDPECLDAHRFERLVAGGRSELAVGRPERAVVALEEGLSLWRGRPLDDLAYEPFAQQAIARLDDMRVAATEELVEARLALSRHADVLAELDPLIAEHPYRERLRAQLMLALYRCDRQADALQAYQDARRALVEGLGIDPGPRSGARGASGTTGYRGRVAGGRRGAGATPGPRGAAHRGGDLPADGHRGLVGSVGGRRGRDGGCARTARRADRAHRGRTRRTAVEGEG
jgi:DNA-binding SARP family transcriptional activator